MSVGTITLPAAKSAVKPAPKPKAGTAAGLSASQQKTLQDLLTKATAGLTPAQKKQLQAALTATTSPVSTLTSSDLNVSETGTTSIDQYQPAALSIFQNPLTAAQKVNFGKLTQLQKTGKLTAAQKTQLTRLTGIVDTARQAWRDATPDALEGLLPGQQNLLTKLTALKKAGTLGPQGKLQLKNLQKLQTTKTTALTAYNTTQKTAFDTKETTDATTAAANAVAPGQELNRTYGSDLAQRAKWSVLQRQGYNATVTRGHGDPGFGMSVLRP